MADRHLRARFDLYPADPVHDGPPSEEERALRFPDGPPVSVRQFDDGSWIVSYRDATGMGREIKAGRPEDEMGRQVAELLAWLMRSAGWTDDDVEPIDDAPSA